MLEIQPDIDHNGRMTMLDERYLSVADLQERQQKLDHEIKSLDLGTLEITEDDLYDEC
ncbi:unnamed protein product, partial [Rotaria magnacalcarata]